MPDYFLILDQGGQSSRALVVDGCGSVITQVQVPVATQYLDDGSYPAIGSCSTKGFVEQRPDEVVDSVVEAAGSAILSLSNAQKSKLSAAALVTQRASLVCWDKKNGETLSPVIGWQDTRAASWLEQSEIDAEWVHQLTGLRLSPYYGASKMRWCLENLEAVKQAKQRDRLVCGPLATFLTFRLLQERPLLVDPANASRTLLMNLEQSAWAPELLGTFGIPKNILPKIVPTSHLYGHLDIEGLRLPLRLVNGDQSAALFAQGNLKPAHRYINAGTGAFIAAPSSMEAAVLERLLKSVVFADKKHTQTVVEGTVNGAAAALEWARKSLNCDYHGELDNWCQTIEHPPLFLNGVGGLGSPFWQPHFESRFLGEGSEETKMVAVLESIVFMLNLNLTLMVQPDVPTESIVVTGGLARVDSFCTKLADLSGCSVCRPELTEASALGAAFLVAGQPDSWVSDEGDIFPPTSPRNEPLLDRYQAWHEAMLDTMLKSAL